MSTISKPYTFSSGTTIVSAEVNSNFDTIFNDYNGSINNSNIGAAAAIAGTKVAPNFGAQNVVTTGDGQFATVTASATVDATGNITTSGSALVGTDLEVGGDASIVGTLDVTGAVTVGSIFGAWVDKSGSYASQVAASDGFVSAYIAQVDYEIEMYTDAANPPTTIRNGACDGNYNTIGGLMPVRKGDYWKVVFTQNGAGGTPKVYWLPLGA